MESTLGMLSEILFRGTRPMALARETDGSCERAVVTTTAMLAPDVSFGHSEQEQHTTKLSDRKSSVDFVASEIF